MQSYNHFQVQIHPPKSRDASRNGLLISLYFEFQFSFHNQIPSLHPALQNKLSKTLPTFLRCHATRAPETNTQFKILRYVSFRRSNEDMAWSRWDIPGPLAYIAEISQAENEWYLSYPFYRPSAQHTLSIIRDPFLLVISKSHFLLASSLETIRFTCSVWAIIQPKFTFITLNRIMAPSP